MSNLRSDLLAAGATSWYDARDIDNTAPFYLAGSTTGPAVIRRAPRVLVSRAATIKGSATT